MTEENPNQNSDSVSSNLPPSPESFTKECRYCFQTIRREAKVCLHCGRHQNRFWQHFRFEQVGLVISIIMVLIAFSQLREARSQRIAASNALERALKAEEAAQSAAEQATNAEKNVKALDDAFRRQVLLITSITWLQLETKSEFGTERATKATSEILSDINSVLPVALPDNEKRARWIHDLKLRLPQR